MMQRLFLFPVRHPFVALALTLAITAGFATQIPKLEVESDWTQWIRKGDGAVSSLDGALQRATVVDVPSDREQLWPQRTPHRGGIVQRLHDRGAAAER